MKKIIATLLVFSILVSQISLSFAADDIASVDFAAVNLTNINQINSTGLTASGEYRKSGQFTALLSGIDLQRNIDLPVIKNDFSLGKYLEFYLYSPAKYNTRFALALYSDNKETVCRDYYYTMINTNFEGWKLISVELSDFKAVHSPVGMDKIDYACIMPCYGGYTPAEGTELYFDNIYVRSEQSEDADEISGGTSQKAFVLLDPEKGGIGTATTADLNGVPCLKWAGEENIKKAIQITTKNLVDFSLYGEMKLSIYSQKATNNTANIVLYADNPDTKGNDYYRTSFTIDWENEWREFSFVLNEGANGSFSTGHTPIGWDTITLFDLGIGGFTNETVDPQTSLYIGKITLEGTPKTDEEIVGDYILEHQYDAATMTDYAAMIKEKNPENNHPRLILTDEKIAEIKKYKDSDTYLKTSWSEVMAEADAYLKTPLTPSSTNGKRLDWTPSTLIPTCALAYVITEDTRYKDRAWEEIENICSFQNWNPKHFLDVGEYSRAIALAYDWLYDEWSEDQKQFMRNSVMKNAFANDALKQLRNGNGSWLSQRSNWVEVGASGIGLCALAFADEDGYEELCNEILYRTIEVHLPQKGLFMFAPDGAYSEGIGYWNYALYTFYLLTGSMHTALGTDMNLETYDGLEKTAYFPLAVIGPNGMFAFSDSDVDILPGGAPVYHYVGQRYNVPNLSSYRVNNCDVADYRDIIWYDPSYTKLADYSEGLPLDYFASGYEPLGSFRTGYLKNSYYFGFKGGNNNGNHDQYDIGSFVIDANGVRWAEELGPEAYSVTGERFTYYRNRAEGNNTMVINPDNDIDDQTSNAEDTISDYISKGSNDGAAYGVFDITKAYKADLTKAHRGFALVNNRTQFIVRDEISANDKSEYYSFYHVKKSMDIDISADGKSLILTSDNGKKCAVNLVSSVAGAKFDQMDAVHLETSPTPPADGTNNSDFKKFYVHAEGVTDASFTVVYTPLLDDEAISLPDIKAFEDWDEYIESSVTLSSLSIDGIAEASFAPGVANYIVPSEEVGFITATADNGVLVSITQAIELGDTAVIKVQSADGTQEGTYKVKFEKPLDPPVKAGADIVAVKASDVPQPANMPENTYDGDLNTRWSAEGEQWIEWDMGSSKTVNGISLAFLSGDTRRNVFKIDLSEDGVNYTTVYEGKSSGNTLELEQYDFDLSWARYVRYTGYGNENYEGEMINPWNSPSEVVIHEIFTDFEDTIGHWANDDINYMRKYSLVNGVSSTLFSPDSYVTAAQFIVMICRACEFGEDEYNGSFTDVSADSWYAPYIGAAVKNNIIPAEMVKDGRLNPDTFLTRAQMSAIAVKAYESISSKETPTYKLTDKFADVYGNEYANYIDKAMTLRLVNGTSDTAFEPAASLTRAQAATIAKRLFVKLYNDFN